VEGWWTGYLIQVQAMATRIACLRTTARHLKDLRDTALSELSRQLAHINAGDADEAAL
jgi:hypothetical protein